MGQSCSSTLCMGEADDVVQTNRQQNRAARFGKKKGQKKRGAVNGTITSECADPKMFNLMTQSILQQQMLRQQQYQPQPLTAPVSPSSKPAAAAASSISNTNLGGQAHLLYRKHPKSILALKGSSSSAQQSQNSSAQTSSHPLPPWGPMPRRNVPTKLIVRRPRRGTFPLSYQDEGLSGTQIYAMRYWIQNSSGGNAKGLDSYSTGGRSGRFDEDDNIHFFDKDDDQDCVWMMMKDDEEDKEEGEDDDDDELIQQRRKQRQQEQHPGRRKNAGSNALQSLAATTGALPTLIPIYPAKSGGGTIGYSTNVPTSAFRDLERKRQPSTTTTTTTTTTIAGDVANTVSTAGITDTTTSNAGCNSSKDGSSKTAAATTAVQRNTLDDQSRATSAVATVSSTPAAASPAWSMPNPSSATAAAAALPNGDFYTPQALAMRQPRQVVDWITISEEYNIHVADVGLTPAECDHLVQVTEQVCRGQYAAYTYAKQTLGCREFPVLAQACVEPVHAVVEAIRTYTTLHPHNSSAYFGCNNLQLDDREPHMVKYDVTKKERQKLDMHTDKSEWTFLIALSNGSGLDYDGGGTFFECLDATIHVQRGHALIFPGKLRHCGQRITTGLRFILVGFLVDKPMLPLNGPPASPPSNPLAASARCSGPMAIPPDHHRA